MKTKVPAMWEQYVKTFARTQAVILAVTIGTYFYMGHVASRSAVFFLMMQAGGVVGAMWGTRLKRKVDGQA
jgi:uncharacterized membrane protein YfcA